MPYVTAADGAQIYYEDRGEGKEQLSGDPLAFLRSVA
jgi:hypothetical protein